MSNEERKNLLGALLPDVTDKRQIKKYTPKQQRRSLPSLFDWRSNNGNFVTPVKNQGKDCGSCWAFATTAALESEILITSGSYPGLDLSEQIVLSCSNAGNCEQGGYISLASNFLRDTGTNTETCYPYTVTNGNCNNACSDWQNNTFKIDKWSYVSWGETTDVSDIKNAIYESGPVVSAFYVYEDFFSYNSGVYSYAWGQYLGGHAIVIVGWDDASSAFIVKNSWDSSWGESGYFRIAYSELQGKTQFGCWTFAYHSNVCVYSISPAGKSFTDGGGTGNVSAVAPDGCSWTAVSNDNWITINSGTSGNGNGTVSYLVASNTSTDSRTGTMTIAGNTFTVTQSGIICSYSISAASKSFTDGGGTGNVSVTAPDGCNWTSESNNNWITVNSGNSGNGNGTVSYSVASNTSIDSRTGIMIIAGNTFMVTQSGMVCYYSISPASKPFTESGGTGSVNVTAPDGCSWTATSNDNWISVNSGNSGDGNGTVSYSVASYSGTVIRTGTMTIAGKTFTITQPETGTNILIWDSGNWDEKNWN